MDWRGRREAERSQNITEKVEWEEEMEERKGGKGKEKEGKGLWKGGDDSERSLKGR